MDTHDIGSHWIFENDENVMTILDEIESLHADFVPESLVKMVSKHLDTLSIKDKQSVIQLMLEASHEHKKFNPVRHLLLQKSDPMMSDAIRSIFKSRGRFFQNFEALAKCPKAWSEEKIHKIKRRILDIMTKPEKNHLLISGPVLFPVLHKTLAVCKRNNYIKV